MNITLDELKNRHQCIIVDMIEKHNINLSLDVLDDYNSIFYSQEFNRLRLKVGLTQENRKKKMTAPTLFTLHFKSMSVEIEEKIEELKKDFDLLIKSHSQIKSILKIERIENES